MGLAIRRQIHAPSGAPKAPKVMSKNEKSGRPEARLPKGFRDYAGEELRQTTRMLGVIREVYERYGYEPLETPAFEYTDALGKFLPDQDRPNAGVFSLQDEDEQWMSLRYDMTAPLARYVAENALSLPKPYRRYTMGPVWRNEKPGPGRFRQFMQCDADTVGTDNVAADAEACMLMADVIEALGMKRGDLQGQGQQSQRSWMVCWKPAGIDPASEADAGRRLTVLRAMDKFDQVRHVGCSAVARSRAARTRAAISPRARNWRRVRSRRYCQFLTLSFCRCAGQEQWRSV